MRLPIASSIESRDGSLSKDAKLVNCFVDVEGETSFVVKRPGLRKSVTSAAGTGLGMVSWEGNMYHAVGSTFYQTSYASIPSGGASSPSDSSTIETVGTFAFNPYEPDGYCTQLQNGLSLTVCLTGSYGTTYRLTSNDGGATWGATVSDADFMSTETGRIACGYIGGNLVRIYYSESHVQGDRVDVSANNGASWSYIGNQAAAYGSKGYPYNVMTSTLVDSGLMYYFVISMNGTSTVLDDTLVLRVTNGTTAVSNVATIPGLTNQQITESMIRGFFKLGSAYYFYLFCANYPTPVTRIYKSLNLTEWTYSDIAIGGYAGYSLISDGTSIALFNGETVIKINLSDLSVESTEALARPSTIAGAITTITTNSFTHDGKSVVTYLDQDAGVGYACKIHIGAGAGQSYVSSPYSYSFTTATPGLPLSWVGTSPGTYTKKMFIKNTEKAWTLTLGTPGTLTQVTDPDYPAATVPGAVYLDGYFFVMDKDGTVYNCDLENPDSWNALNYITAEAEWDKGVAIAKHQNYVVALKDWTCELFYDAANPVASPLSKVANATIQIGCAQGYSAVQFHGGLIFVSKTRERGRSVHFFASNSIEPQEIASAAIQRILNAADLTTVRAWGGKLGGRILYVLNLVTANITLVYDFTSQTWAQWTSDNAGTDGYFKYGFYATDGNRDFLLHETTGEVFTFTPDVYQDNGADIKVLIRSGRLDSGNLDRKTMSALTVVGDKAATSVSVQYSDDDYQTFSTARTVAMDAEPPRLSRLGMFRRRSFDIRHVDNTPLRLAAIDAEIKQAR